MSTWLSTLCINQCLPAPMSSVTQVQREPAHWQDSQLQLVCSSSYYFLWHWKPCPVPTIIPRTTFPYAWSHKVRKPATESAGAAIAPPTFRSNPLGMEPSSGNWFSLHSHTRNTCSIAGRNVSYLGSTESPVPTNVLCTDCSSVDETSKMIYKYHL